MFRRPSVRYGTTPEPVTPYQKAAQVWDERIGSARVQARNWRLMARGCLALAAGLSGLALLIEPLIQQPRGARAAFITGTAFGAAYFSIGMLWTKIS